MFTIIIIIIIIVLKQKKKHFFTPKACLTHTFPILTP